MVEVDVVQLVLHLPRKNHMFCYNTPSRDVESVSGPLVQFSVLAGKYVPTSVTLRRLGCDLLGNWVTWLIAVTVLSTMHVLSPAHIAGQNHIYGRIEWSATGHNSVSWDLSPWLRFVPRSRPTAIDHAITLHSFAFVSHRSSVIDYTAAQCIVIGPVCGFVTAGGRAVSEPYYSQRARSVCVSLSAFFISSLGWKYWQKND